LLLAAGSVLGDYTPEALADQITNLPGAENLDFKFNQFSGYIKVNGTKNLHYWLVESQNAPSTDPIAFWTNGGPGCSGLLGFLTEQGPFRATNKDLSLSWNDYSWNKIANMVFIEQPCGVGFSYTDDESSDDYSNNDAQAAKDNYALIQGFLDRFPQFRSNDLYVTSESYGGHYIPMVSREIVDRNTAGLDPQINFKGFFLGNPATTFKSTTPASLDTFWGHQLVSKPLWDKYTENCVTPLIKNITVCGDLFTLMYVENRGLNPYALDYPVCTEDSRTNAGIARKYGRSQRTWLMNHILPSLFTTEADEHGNYKLTAEHQTMLSNIKQTLGLQPVDGYEPCSEDYMTSYLNQASVKTAIHVKTDVDWLDCSRTIRYKQADGHHDMTPHYNYLIDGGYKLKLVVYSGDDDDVCATSGSQSWVWDLGYEVAGKQWQAYTVNGQVGGYLTKWSNTGFAFATVRAAGHEVPTYKPDVAFWLWESYLKGDLTNA